MAYPYLGPMQRYYTIAHPLLIVYKSSILCLIYFSSLWGCHILKKEAVLQRVQQVQTDKSVCCVHIHVGAIGLQKARRKGCTRTANILARGCKNMCRLLRSSNQHQVLEAAAARISEVFSNYHNWFEPIFG